MRYKIERIIENPYFSDIGLLKENSQITSRLVFIEKFPDNINVNWEYEQLLEKYLSRYKKDIKNNYNYQKEYINELKKALIDYFYELELFDLFYNEDEMLKIKELIQRKQYSSNLLQKGLDKIIYISAISESYDSILLIAVRPSITKRIDEFIDSIIIKEMKPLKDIVDKVASGVKKECYLEFKDSFDYKINEELDSYIKEKYKINIYESSTDFFLDYIDESSITALSFALINDESFWKSKGYRSKKNIIGFASLVAKYNDIAHAKKIIDYAFEKYCSQGDVCKYLLENKLPLNYSFDYNSRIIEYAKSRILNKLNYLDLDNINKTEYNGLLYPIFDVQNEKIEKGRMIFEDFLKVTFSNHYQKILSVFDNLDIIIQKESNETSGVIKREVCLRNMLESDIFGFDFKNKLRGFYYGYYNNFRIDESIMKRFYYRIYLISKLTNNKVNDSIYEVYFDLFDMISKTTNVVNAFVSDNSLRESSYNGLKEQLSKFDINISDEYKHLYINSLLDRKYANVDEIEMFPQLEQLGDAIYDLAVSNILFYNPNTSLNHENKEKIVNAKNQIEVAKLINIDRLYISNLHSNTKTKYQLHEEVESGMGLRKEGNYIADSLEMVIGTIAKEFGIQKALDFTTKLISKAFNLEMPHFVKFDFINIDVERDYFVKIYPSLNDIDNSNYSHEYNEIKLSLFKLMNIVIIGNETKEKRRMITNHIGMLTINGKNIDGYITVYNNDIRIVCAYLYNGIEKTIEDYKKIIVVPE